jgi:hypothetical protein
MHGLVIELAIVRMSRGEAIEVLGGLLVIERTRAAEVFDKVINCCWHNIPFSFSLRCIGHVAGLGVEVCRPDSHRRLRWGVSDDCQVLARKFLVHLREH